MQHDNPWGHLGTKTVYEDEWIVVNRDEVIRPDNNPGTYTYIDSKDSVMIIALNKNAEIYLEWTYRYPVKSWGWELPGGGADKLTGLESAKAELEEEAGYTSDKWTSIGMNNVYNGLVTGSIEYFVAENLQTNGRVLTDDNEITNTGRFFSIDVINEMISKSEINDSQTISGIHLFELRSSSKYVQ